MPFKTTDFADDTDFERFTLDPLGPHRVQVGEAQMIYHDEANPVGGGRSRISVTLGAAEMGGRAREELRQSLRPVGFGSAYKILDMLVEHVLRANGHKARRLNFKEKATAVANRPVSLPVPLDLRPDVWDRMARVYVVFQDASHAITHRRAQVTSAGDLEVYDDVRVLTDTISGPALAAFSAAVHALAEAVIDGDADPRRTGIVAWHLNALQSHHGLSSLTATDPDGGRRLLIMDLIPVDGDLLRFDVVRAQEIVAGQTPSLWDLELRAGERTFVGRWEGTPAAGSMEVDFHPASPRRWLSERAT